MPVPTLPVRVPSGWKSPGWLEESKGHQLRVGRLHMAAGQLGGRGRGPRVFLNLQVSAELG